MSKIHQISRMVFDRFQHNHYQPKGLISEPEFEWIRDHSRLPWLKLDVEIPVQIILTEIQAIRHLLVSHRDNYNEHQGWESFCIHGRGYNFTREDECYSESDPDYHWTTEAKQYMPSTVQYFQTQWPGQEFQRIRVMRLAPNGYISVHKDSTSDQLHPINIAITQPQSCAFVMEKHGTVPFHAGSAFWLNVSNRHVVFNDSDQERWHIIVHQKNDNIKFREVVAKSYNILYNQLNENSNNTNP